MRATFSRQPSSPSATFNQYGGTLGGPVLRNKVFFFGTYEGYREKVELNLNTDGAVPVRSR